MRKKSITVFISVYAALCIAYGVAGSVIMPDNNDIIQAVEQETSQISFEDTISERSEISEVESYVEESSEEVLQEYSEPQQSEEEIEDNGDEYSEEKPTLEEFLKSLRCSGCRHNCTLFSPRCMNGARKASQAQSQYYEMYNA